MRLTQSTNSYDRSAGFDHRDSHGVIEPGHNGFDAGSIDISPLDALTTGVVTGRPVELLVAQGNGKSVRVDQSADQFRNTGTVQAAYIILPSVCSMK